MECAFDSGLNVVLGPNEAGKTTLVNAIHAALFIPPGVRKNSHDWKNIIAHYLPHPHGDTARVTLEFAGDGEDRFFRLCCAWGAEREARLVMSEGGEISDEGSVQRKLEELLRHGRGTYEEVLMARQAELVNTLDRIKQDQEALSTLADMLRAVVFHSGGVSVDELEKKLRENIHALESNWDFHSDAPRGGRDIDNPHRRSVGLILEQYYEVRGLQKNLKAAREAEEAFETAIQNLQQIESDYKEVEQKEKEMKKIESDVSRRNALEPQLESFSFRQEQLKKITREWPTKEERAGYLAEEKETQEKEKKRLEEELAASQIEQELKKKREVYRKAGQLKEELDGRKEEHGRLPRVSPEKMQALDKMEKELSGLKAEIGGMKLKIKLFTEEALEVRTSSGLEEETTLQAEGESVFEARGRFNLAAPGWSISVQSGEKDVEALLQKVGELEGALAEELHGLGLPGTGEARKIRQKADKLEGEIRTLEERLQDALKGHSFEELREELEAAGEEKPVRDPAEINKAVAEKEFKIRDLAREMGELEEQLNGWRDEYGDYDSVLEAMVEMKGKSTNMREELDRLAPLPEKYADAEEFLTELRELRERKEDLWNRLFACREEKIRAEGSMPEESPEEMEEALRGAEKKLQDLKSEAAALRAVEKEFNRLKEELDASTFYPLQELFKEYLYPLTGHRYSYAHMEGALPEGIAPEEEAASKPLELLSYGTISGVALALRLAMARYLLQESEGFIVMDDPMVDLDPERKKQAAEVLQKAAEDKQIIITTFDPATAELLGGNTVEI